MGIYPAAVAWQRVWFELEILNGLALAQWEDEGKPDNWSCRWNTDYRREAAALALQGTPAFIINGNLIPGGMPQAQLEAVSGRIRSGPPLR